MAVYFLFKMLQAYVLIKEGMCAQKRIMGPFTQKEKERRGRLKLAFWRDYGYWYTLSLCVCVCVCVCVYIYINQTLHYIYQK